MPKNTGTLYYNYKGFFSIVLLAICDANYCFTMFDLGQYGSNNDSGVLSHSEMGQCFDEGSLFVPDESDIEGTETFKLPYYLVGDEIFPLKVWLMRPYPGPLVEDAEKIFNYRLSRARRTIENAFGILCARWRIFQKPIKGTVENVEKITLAALVLHNYLKQTENATYSPAGFVDSEDKGGNIKEGEWRADNENGGLVSINPVRGCRYKQNAIKMRESIKAYVNSEIGSVPWQYTYMKRTSHSS